MSAFIKVLAMRFAFKPSRSKRGKRQNVSIAFVGSLCAGWFASPGLTQVTRVRASRHDRIERQRSAHKPLAVLPLPRCFALSQDLSLAELFSDIAAPGSFSNLAVWE